MQYEARWWQVCYETVSHGVIHHGVSVKRLSREKPKDDLIG